MVPSICREVVRCLGLYICTLPHSLTFSSHSPLVVQAKLDAASWHYTVA